MRYLIFILILSLGLYFIGKPYYNSALEKRNRLIKEVENSKNMFKMEEELYNDMKRMNDPNLREEARILNGKAFSITYDRLNLKDFDLTDEGKFLKLFNNFEQ